MISSLLHDRIVLDHWVQILFRWWRRELRALVPPRIAEALGVEERFVFLRVLGDTLILEYLGGTRFATFDSRLKPDSEKVRHQTFVLKLPGRLVLRRVLELPLALERQLATALAFEVDRQTPFTVDQVYRTFRVKARDKARKTISVELAVVPIQAVDRLIAHAKAFGIMPTGLVPEDDAEEPRLMFFPAPLRTGRRFWRMEMWKALVAAALVIFFAGLFGLEWHFHSEALRFQQAAVAARGIGARADALRRSLTTAQQATVFLPNKLANLRVTEVADALSQLIPDNAWVYEFEVTDRDVRIAGFSNDVPALIELLQHSPMFATPQLRTPVTHGPGKNADRFDLALTIKPSGT